MVACTGIEPMTLVLSALSTFTLMQEKLHQSLPPSVLTSTTQRFVMTDGTIHQSRDLKNIFYHWHDRECRLDRFILKDTPLIAFPLIAGLDFLTATRAVLAVGEGRYGLKAEKLYTY